MTKLKEINFLKKENQLLRNKLDRLSDLFRNQLALTETLSQQNHGLQDTIKRLQRDIKTLTINLSATEESELRYSERLKEQQNLHHEYTSFKTLLIEHLVNWEKLEQRHYPVLPSDLHEKDVFALFYLYWQCWKVEFDFYEANAVLIEKPLSVHPTSLDDTAVQLRLALKDRTIHQHMEEARAQEVKIEEITQAFLKTDKYKERRILYFKSQIASLEEDNNTLQAEVNELKRALLVNIRSERGGRSNYEVAQSFWQSEVNKGAESDSSFSDSHKSMKHI